jgi:hypothetical protein
MKSLGAKVKQVGAMADTRDLNTWENDFVKRVVEQSRNGQDTRTLSPAQVAKVEELYRRHFGDADD